MPIQTISSPQLIEFHQKAHGYKPADLPDEQTLCLAKVQGDKILACLSCRLGKHTFTASSGEKQQADFGMIGHYACIDRQAGIDLLKEAIERFQRPPFQVSHVVGPMDGSTWGRYRWVLAPSSESEKAPIFLGEPVNPLEYSLQFEQAGMKLLESYESRLMSPIYLRKEAPRLLERLKNRGLSFHSLDIAHYEQALDRLFELSLDSFSHNPYYMPIARSLFLEKYKSFKPLIDPDLVVMVQDASQNLVGFVFAFGDRLQPNRLILKTIATSPSTRPLGLGIALCDLIHQRALDKGYSEVIHALMHVSNSSLRVSNRYESKPMRRYGLYGLYF